MNISRILPKFGQEGIGQIQSSINLAHPGGMIQGKSVARGFEFLAKFLASEAERYKVLLSAASQLKMANEEQIDAFIKGMYTNANLDSREMDNALDTFKNLLSRNKGDGVKSFEDLNTVIPGVLNATAGDAIMKTVIDSLSGAAKIAKGRAGKTKFSTFG